MMAKPIGQKSVTIATTIDKFIKTGQTSTVFKNTTVFSNDYIPKHLFFREEEIQFILSNLTKPFQQITPQNMFIYGPPGTGKTASYRMICSGLNEKAKETGQQIKYHLINVKYKTLSQAMGDIVKIYAPLKPLKGLGFDDYKNIIESNLKNGYIGFIFDDLDKIISKYPYTQPIDILVNTFSRLSEHGYKVFICALVNDRTIEKNFKISTRSVYAPQYLNFRAYNASELSAILKDRCMRGLKEEAYEEQTIDDFGTFLYSTSRDLRTGQDVILEAGYQANMENKTKIVYTDLEKSLKKVEQDTLIESIVKLDETMLIFFYAIAHIQKENKEAESKAVYDFYCKEITKLNIEKCSTRHLSRNLRPQLEVMGLISSYRKGRGKKGVSQIFYIDEDDLDDTYDICKREVQQRIKNNKK